MGREIRTTPLVVTASSMYRQDNRAFALDARSGADLAISTCPAAHSPAAARESRAGILAQSFSWHLDAHVIALDAKTERRVESRPEYRRVTASRLRRWHQESVIIECGRNMGFVDSLTRTMPDRRTQMALLHCPCPGEPDMKLGSDS